MLDKLNWIVVPGGPGLSNNYLKYGLEKAFSGCKLHFYHAFGAPESKNKNPSIDEMIGQIQSVADNAALDEYGLITHSFGNYLAMKALDNSNIKAIIMLNPAPFEFHAWKSALNNIVQSVSEPILKEIAALSKKTESGIELFRMLFPYYIGRKNTVLPIDVLFDVKACNSISEKVTEYDDRAIVGLISIPLVRIVGEKDPFFSEQEILQNQTIVMSNVGHYPFFEDLDSFCKAIKKAEELLCQQMTKKCC